jgi:hypothetical protein
MTSHSASPISLAAPQGFATIRWSNPLSERARRAHAAARRRSVQAAVRAATLTLSLMLSPDAAGAAQLFFANG